MDATPSSSSANPVPAIANTRRIPRALGYAVVLASSTAALWMATVAFLPKAIAEVQLYPVELPGWVSAALGVRLDPDAFAGVIATAGVTLLLGALLHPRRVRTTRICRSGLGILTGLVALLSLYLICAACVANILTTGQRRGEAMVYRRTLDQFALLEVAEGRIAKVRAILEERTRMRMVEVKSANDFGEDEARDKVQDMLQSLAKSENVAIRKRGLATVALFRERLVRYPYAFEKVPLLVEQAGGPAGKSPQEALEWLAANLNKDGWEPLPLFKFTR